MSEFKITDYVDVDSIDGTELVLVSKSGAYRKTTIEEIRNLAADITNTDLADLFGKVASAQDVKNILNTINTSLEDHANSITSINAQMSERVQYSDLGIISINKYGSTGVYSSSIDDAPIFQTAIDTLNVLAKAYNKQSILTVPSGVYRFATQVKIPISVKLKSAGNVKIICEVEERSAIHLYNDGGTSGVNLGAWIDGSEGGFDIKGNLKDINNNYLGTGLEIGNATNDGYNCALTEIEHISIEHFAVGIKFNPYNVYMNTFTRCRVSSNIVNLKFFESGDTPSNTGENITFNDCTTGDATVICEMNYPINIKMIGCSLDFSECCFWVKKVLSNYITLSKCWIEKIGDGAKENYNCTGICKIEDTTDVTNTTCIACYFTLDNCSYSQSSSTEKQNLFTGKYLDLTLINLKQSATSTWSKYPNLFFADDTVTRLNCFNSNNRCSTLGAGRFISKKLNVNPYPEFENVATGSTSITVGEYIGNYQIVTCNYYQSMEIVDTIAFSIGGKSLKITGKTGYGGKLELKNKNFLDTKPMKKIYPMAMVYWLNEDFTTFGLTTKRIIDFYDKDQNLLSTNSTDRYFDSSLRNEGWVKAPTSDAPIVTPQNAFYYKVTWRFNTLAYMNEPFYITGLYIFED